MKTSGKWLKDPLKDLIDDHVVPQKRLSDKRIEYELEQLIKRTKEVEQMIRDSENGKPEQLQQRTQELHQQNAQWYRAEWRRTRVCQEEPLDGVMREEFSDWSERRAELRAEYSEWSEGEEKASEATTPYPKANHFHLPENWNASDKYQQAERRQTKFYEAIQTIFCQENARYTPTAKARALQRLQKRIWKKTRRKMPKESEQVTKVVLERKEKELSEVKAARDKEIAMLKGATQDAIVNPQCQELKGRRLKERLVIKGNESLESKEDCASCTQKGHWKRGDEKGKAAKDETLEGHLHVHKPNEKTHSWIGMMSNSKKESKEVKIKQEDDDNFESKVTKKVTTGEKFQNFAIKDVKYQIETGEL